MLKSLKNIFKIISVLSLVLLTTFFIKPDVALAANFDKTCSNLKLDGDKTHLYLTAICVKTNGEKAASRLEISKYIANHNGQLSWSPGKGGFLKTCVDIRLNEDYSLSARCVGEPQPFISFFALKDYISNQNGVLTPDV